MLWKLTTVLTIVQLIGWLTVTSYLPSSQTMGSVTYPAPVSGGFTIAPPPVDDEEVITNLFGTEATFPISSDGKILEAIEAVSEDGTLIVNVPEGTVALDKDANPLLSLEAEIDTNPPSAPEDTSIIGLAYDFGLYETSFDPPITLTWSYESNDIPEGIAKEDLKLAWYDEIADK